MGRAWERLGRSSGAALVLAALLFAAACSGVPGPVASGAQAAEPAAWSFAVVSDTQGDNKDVAGKSGLNDAIIKPLAEAIAREKIDFLLVSGDLASGWFKNGGTGYDVQYANWRAAMRPVYEAGIRVYPIRGNHDDGPERLALPPLPANLEPPPGTQERMKAAFLAAFPEPYIPGDGPAGEERLTYAFSHKNALVIGLDQYANGQHKINQAWLDRALRGAAGRPCLRLRPRARLRDEPQGQPGLPSGSARSFLGQPRGGRRPGLFLRPRPLL